MEIIVRRDRELHDGVVQGAGAAHSRHVALHAVRRAAVHRTVGVVNRAGHGLTTVSHHQPVNVDPVGASAVLHEIAPSILYSTFVPVWLVKDTMAYMSVVTSLKNMLRTRLLPRFRLEPT